VAKAAGAESAVWRVGKQAAMAGYVAASKGAESEEEISKAEEESGGSVAQLAYERKQ